jgi:hypothetical protein
MPDVEGREGCPISSCMTGGLVQATLKTRGKETNAIFHDDGIIYIFISRPCDQDK